MNKFWNWVQNSDESRTLYLNGTIAEESWFDDDVTPAMFKAELLAGEGDITVWINVEVQYMLDRRGRKSE